jgi:hypothetical protein
MPQLYWTFMRNVVEDDAVDIMTPMPMTSEMAFHVLKRLNVSLDLVHMDARHEFESVQGDLTRSAPYSLSPMSVAPVESCSLVAMAELMLPKCSELSPTWRAPSQLGAQR